MECPKCGSPEVERLPPDQVSKHPGYRCGDCGLRMRSEGMLVTYALTTLLGSVFFLGMGYMLLYEDAGGQWLKAAFLGAAGVVVAGYSLRQISRPVPVRGPEEGRPS